MHILLFCLSGISLLGTAAAATMGAPPVLVELGGLECGVFLAAGAIVVAIHDVAKAATDRLYAIEVRLADSGDSPP